jgi:hypothetical protein
MGFSTVAVSSVGTAKKHTHLRVLGMIDHQTTVRNSFFEKRYTNSYCCFFAASNAGKNRNPLMQVTLTEQQPLRDWLLTETPPEECRLARKLFGRFR